MSGDASPRNSIADTVAAIVVSLVIWALVSMAVHALVYTLNYIQGVSLGTWSQVLWRTLLSSIAGTYVAIHAGKKWFPAAKVGVLYYAFAAIIFLYFVLQLFVVDTSEFTKKQWAEIFAGVVSICTGYYVVRKMKEEDKA